MNLDDFAVAGMDVVFQEYKNVEYAQLYPKVGFVADLSIVDLLFNCGKNSLEVIERGRMT
jgi:hypothetical protein